MKSNLRSKFLAQRLELSAFQIQQKSAQILQHVLDFMKQIPPRNVMAFSAFRNEPDLFEGLLTHCRSQSIAFGLPKVLAPRNMNFFEVHNKGELTKNRWGILEPQDAQKPLTVTQQTLLLVPCLAVDPVGTRLGYGGGFYDTFLKINSPGFAIGLLFEQFFVDHLPQNPHDQILTKIITEQGLKNLPLSLSCPQT